jgi:hypothetical protein
MSVVIIDVCHDINSLKNIVNRNNYIFFVSNNELPEEYCKNPKIIIARNLPFNIEHEPKLLTFTAWYAIIRNNLFTEFEYLCILEYDTILEHNFVNNLDTICAVNKYDLISFIEASEIALYLDINIDVLKTFLNYKNISNINLQKWACSTNHCFKRNILEEFVDWYYPDCLIIKEKHPTKFSFYHERLFMIWLKNKNISYFLMKGLEHCFSNSHKYGGLNNLILN